MFDFFKGLFEGWFGGEKEDLSAWGGDDDDNFSWSPDVDASDITLALDLEERLMPDTEDSAAGAEYVQEFYDLQSVLDYVEGTPVNILRILIDPDNEVYYVYRFTSE